MNTTSSVVLTGVVVTTGQWSQGKSVTMRIVVGASALALALAIMSGSNEELAEKFGALILLLALFTYLPSIIKKTGLAKK
jgi:hypothetical protein